MIWPPRVHIVPTPVVGVVLVGIESDDNDCGRGGQLRMSEAALALLPEALAKAIEARRCPADRTADSPADRPQDCPVERPQDCPQEPR